MEHNKNDFTPEAAVADAADEALQTPPATTSNLPATVASDAPPTLVDFDPVTLRARCDGWTGEKQRWFIEELADCGIVREAAARVGMTEQSAMRLRRRDACFAG